MGSRLDWDFLIFPRELAQNEKKLSLLEYELCMQVLSFLLLTVKTLAHTQTPTQRQRHHPQNFVIRNLKKMSTGSLKYGYNKFIYIYC